MEASEAYNLLKSKFDLEHLFSVGHFHKYENVIRIHLDEKIELNSVKDYESFFLDLFKDYFTDSIFICLTTQSWKKTSTFPKLEKNRLNKAGINIDIESSMYFSKYIKEEEWYVHSLFYKADKLDLVKYYPSILNNIEDVKHFFWSDVFIVSEDLKYCINIYDDRGVDITSLNIWS